MADATAFVDDVVTGRLPAVCIKTGAPADAWAGDSAQVGRLGAAWVLVFFGPVGWLILALIAAVGRERLQVVLPYASTVLDKVRRLTRWRNIAGAGCGVALLALVAAPRVVAPAGEALGVLLVVTGVAALLAALVLHVRVEMWSVGVSLDGSRRWVTLRGVSETFARELRAEHRAARAREDQRR